VGRSSRRIASTGGFLEPGELFERKQELTTVDQHPKPCFEMFVTSAAEVALPRISDLLLVIDD
jgi:hypothetical protein